MFLNKDISLITGVRCLKFCMCILHNHWEGTLSTIFLICCSFDVMESRKKIMIKITKNYPFVIIK